MSLTKVDSLSWLKHLLEVVTFLDLFATNRPSFIQQVGVKSGVSDHEIICVESTLEAVVLESNPCKVYLWQVFVATTLHLTIL